MPCYLVSSSKPSLDAFSTAVDAYFTKPGHEVHYDDVQSSSDGTLHRYSIAVPQDGVTPGDVLGEILAYPNPPGPWTAAGIIAERGWSVQLIEPENAAWGPPPPPWG